jgi:hypothetical protein
MREDLCRKMKNGQYSVTDLQRAKNKSCSAYKPGLYARGMEADRAAPKALLPAYQRFPPSIDPSTPRRMRLPSSLPTARAALLAIASNAPSRLRPEV